MAEYTVIDCPVWMDGKEALLATTGGPIEARRIVAISGREARVLWNQGRLDGWTPVDAPGQIHPPEEA